MHYFAPGKVVLMGEFSVVDGGQALVAAIDHGVSVHATASPDLLIKTPTNDLFVRPALNAAGAQMGEFVFSDSYPSYGGKKIGVGGSAAATVAAIAAAYGLREEKIDPQTLFDLAHRVHQGVQGAGSGVDIAASVWGGLLRYQARQATPAQGLLPLLIWSGESASTGPRVMQYQRLDNDYRDKFRTLSDTLVAQYARDPIAALNENGALIADMAEMAGFSYLTPTISRIIALAKSLGGGAKPSGAGGGDCVLALFHDPSQEREFVHQLNKFDSVCVIPISLSMGVTRL